MVLTKRLEHKLNFLRHLVVNLILTHIDMKIDKIKTLLSKATTCPSKWELDTIIWADRTTNPKVLVRFLNRVKKDQFFLQLNGQLKKAS